MDFELIMTSIHGDCTTAGTEMYCNVTDGALLFRGVAPYEHENEIYVQREGAGRSSVFKAYLDSCCYEYGLTEHSVIDFELREEYIFATVRNVSSPNI